MYRNDKDKWPRDGCNLLEFLVNVAGAHAKS